MCVAAVFIQVLPDLDAGLNRAVSTASAAGPGGAEVLACVRGRLKPTSPGRAWLPWAAASALDASSGLICVASCGAVCAAGNLLGYQAPLREAPSESEASLNDAGCALAVALQEVLDLGGVSSLSQAVLEHGGVPPFYRHWRVTWLPAALITTDRFWSGGKLILQLEHTALGMAQSTYAAVLTSSAYREWKRCAQVIALDAADENNAGVLRDGATWGCGWGERGNRCGCCDTLLVRCHSCTGSSAPCPAFLKTFLHCPQHALCVWRRYAHPRTSRLSPMQVVVGQGKAPVWTSPAKPRSVNRYELEPHAAAAFSI
jgi:hypothetical protein